MTRWEDLTDNEKTAVRQLARGSPRRASPNDPPPRRPRPRRPEQTGRPPNPRRPRSLPNKAYRRPPEMSTAPPPPRAPGSRYSGPKRNGGPSATPSREKPQGRRRPATPCQERHKPQSENWRARGTASTRGKPRRPPAGPLSPNSGRRCAAEVRTLCDVPHHQARSARPV